MLKRISCPAKLIEDSVFAISESTFGKMQLKAPEMRLNIPEGKKLEIHPDEVYRDISARRGFLNSECEFLTFSEAEEVAKNTGQSLKKEPTDITVWW